MLWDTKVFTGVHAALGAAAGSGDAETFLQIAKPVMDDVRALLETPARSSSQRSKLATRTITIAGEEMRVNEAFVNDAALISDELDLDELAAAELVFYAAGDARRLAVPAPQAALTLFFVRRALIINILQFLLERVSFERLQLKQDFALKALKAVEAQIARREERTRANAFIGFSNSLEQLCYRFLVSEQDSLGGLLAAQVQVCEQAPISQVIEHLKTISSWDQCILAYLPAVVLAAARAQQRQGEPPKEWSNLCSQAWKLPFLQHAVHLVFLAFTADADMKDLRTSIDGGAIETWLALALALAQHRGVRVLDFLGSLLIRRVPKLQWRAPALSASARERMQSALELLVSEFIVQRADVLTEMQLCEEDAYYTLSIAEKNQSAVTVSNASSMAPPGVDLERVFALVSVVYYGAPSNAQFCDEANDTQIGFLIWGASCKVSYTAAFYVEMLASLASTEQGAAGMHSLLKNYGRKLFSYEYLAAMLGDYASGTIKRSKEVLLVCSAYLHLVEAIAGNCPAAREELLSRSIVHALLRMLKLQQPVAGAVFGALASLAPAETWPAIEKLLRGRLDALLESPEDVLRFLRLASSAPEPHCMDFVLNSVFTWAAAPSTTGTDTTSTGGNASGNAGMGASSVSAGASGKITGAFTSGSGVSNGTVSASSSDLMSTVAEYALEIRLSCLRYLQKYISAARSVCFEPPVYRALLSIFETPLEELHDLGETHPRVQAAEVAADIVAQLLEHESVESVEMNFGRPVLYCLGVVPQWALYAGSRFSALSLACSRVLSLLRSNPLFHARVGRQNRILSIIASSSLSSCVRVGWMGLLADREGCAANKRALLSILLEDLREAPSYPTQMTLAHFLLGFRQNALAPGLELELDNGVGGVQTGSSLLHVVCDLLLAELELPARRELLALCTSILGQLVVSEVTGSLLLDYLRPSGFLLTTCRLEPRQPAALAACGFDFYEHRATMLEIWRREIVACRQQLLLTVEHHYLSALAPNMFELLSVPVDCPAVLRCLVAWCDLVPVLVSSGSPEVGSSFVARALETLVEQLPLLARTNTLFARPVAHLLGYLFAHHLRSGVDAALLTASFRLYSNALRAVQPAAADELLRRRLYDLCLQYLKAVLTTRGQDVAPAALAELCSAGDGVLLTVLDDVFNESFPGLATSALSLTTAAIKLARSLDDDQLVKVCLRNNFVGCLVEQRINLWLLAPATIEQPASGTEQPTSTEESKREQFLPALSLLMSVAQTREGALAIVRSQFVAAAERALDKLPENVLIIVVETLATMLISLGTDYSEFLRPLRSLIRSNSNLLEEAVSNEHTGMHRSATLLVALAAEH